MAQPPIARYDAVCRGPCLQAIIAYSASEAASIYFVRECCATDGLPVALSKVGVDAEPSHFGFFATVAIMNYSIDRSKIAGFRIALLLEETGPLTSCHLESAL